MSAKDENPIVIKIRQIVNNERKRNKALCKGDYSETQYTCERLLEKFNNSTRLDELTAIDEAIVIIKRLSEYENGPCNFDHHGYCQDHPGEHKLGDCAIVAAREFLERHK